ncbi:MAG TPA: SRPBCC family protein [Acidimicrobiales bacterium]|nr:SRPBCC family protein [Acidimicrobiales bacterium]
MPRIYLETVVAAERQLVYDLSLDVDVHMGSTRPSNEQAVLGITHGRMTLHDEVTWKARHFGITWRVRSRITAAEPPTTFTDEMQSGPFRRWCHVHRFEAHPAGTLMVDEVDYAAPVPVPVLHGYMVRLLQARNHHIRTLAEGGRA